MQGSLNVTTSVLENDKRWYILENRLYEVQIEKAFSFFRANGIEPILIKGWAAGLTYPDNEPRLFTDIDLAVSASDYQRAQILLISDVIYGISIDLHNELRYLDTVSWADLFANSRLANLGDAQIRVLRPEDHLRLLCVHWLADGGANKDRLRDIYYAVVNRPADFDWARCLDAAGPSRRGWLLCVIGLANRYFDLSLDGLPFAEEAKNIPAWVIKCVEREWRDYVHLLPLVTFLHDRKQFFRQLRKRIPPNPIRAMVEMEGKIDGNWRHYYQIGSFTKRLTPFFRTLPRNLISFVKR